VGEQESTLAAKDGEGADSPIAPVDEVEPVGAPIGEESSEEYDPEREARKQLALAQIRRYGDPALRLRAHEVEHFDEELARIIERMLALMHDADGVGLAATQIGVLRRFFVFNDDGTDRVLVNPEIVERSEETEVDEEGCLSLNTVRVPVERSVAVTIEGREVSGEPTRLELEGFSARVVQHELDHLDGTLIIDRTDAESRRAALAQLRPRIVLTR
jgi:peptide deformylase